MLCVNIAGKFENPIIIGKAMKPRCFKGVKIEKVKMNWKVNKSAWMDTHIMTVFLEKLYRKMKRAKRKIVLFLDNATCHPSDIKLSNIKLVFFPANTSSVCQPLDLGVIKNFKVLYRKATVETCD